MKKLTKWKKFLISGMVLSLLVGGAAEVALRMAGFVDFPLYVSSSVVGYIPAPSQSGAFLNKNRWVTNERSMGTENPWKPNGSKDLLLIGDSIVWGGNPLNQTDKLGPQIQKRLPDWGVWPISAASWSASNETTWINENPDIAGEADTIVWIMNSGDFWSPSQWKSDITHPRTHPVSALLFVLRKYVMPRIGLSNTVESTGSENAIDNQTAESWADEIFTRNKFLTNRNLKILVVCYPTKAELAQGGGDGKFQNFKNEMLRVTKNRCKLLDLSTTAAWTADLYNDGIHPTPAGYSVLADEIHKALKD